MLRFQRKKHVFMSAIQEDQSVPNKTKDSKGHTKMPPAKGQQPNIVFIMADDIGWSNIGAYNQGLMWR